MNAARRKTSTEEDVRTPEKKRPRGSKSKREKNSRRYVRAQPVEVRIALVKMILGGGIEKTGENGTEIEGAPRGKKSDCQRGEAHTDMQRGKMETRKLARGQFPVKKGTEKARKLRTQGGARVPSSRRPLRKGRVSWERRRVETKKGD